jgi:hypothetical protein
MVYWKGRYLMKAPSGHKSIQEVEAFQAGFLAGLAGSNE